MNTNASTNAPFSGLISLVADAVEPSCTGTPTGQTVAPSQAPGVPALGQISGAWMAVKEDGEGWMLLRFTPNPEIATSVDEPTPEARSLPTRPDFGSRARRVHTALTEREREVLSLVASGATNRGIGERLFMSPKTASVHVSRILTKLDATTRTEAAAVAHAAGLVPTWGPTPTTEPRQLAGPSLVPA